MNQTSIQLGLKANWKQFTLLVIVNAFVGGMVGMERSILPEFAREVFDMDSKSAILSFIAAFGVAKALTNYVTGRLANRFGRRNLLIAGWVLGLAVPFILMNAPSWSWVIAANVFLGISQGLAWSSTVVMKIDLVGEKDRGFAMGLNEFAGYLAVGLAALAAGAVAETWGITPYPFYLGVGFAAAGLALTLLWIKDTRVFIQQESQTDAKPLIKNVFWGTTLTDKNLSSVTQAGLVNNLNDGMIWGLLPILLAGLAFDKSEIGVLAAVYPTVWGLGQLFTGRLADKFPAKHLLFWGMLMQGIAILFIPFISGFWAFAIIGAALGLGTALVYPTFLTAIASATSAKQRAESLGTFRLWRDLGYAAGAVFSGIIADWLGLDAAVWATGVVTIGSAGVILVRMTVAAKQVEEGVCVEPGEVMNALQHGGKVRLIDVRSHAEFDGGHVPGAWNIPLSELKNQISKLDKGYRYVVICAKGGGRSAEAAKLMRALGYQVKWLCGGTLDWPGMQAA